MRAGALRKARREGRNERNVNAGSWRGWLTSFAIRSKKDDVESRCLSTMHVTHTGSFSWENEPSKWCNAVVRWMLTVTILFSARGTSLDTRLSRRPSVRRQTPASRSNSHDSRTTSSCFLPSAKVTPSNADGAHFSRRHSRIAQPQHRGKVATICSH